MKTSQEALERLEALERKIARTTPADRQWNSEAQRWEYPEDRETYLAGYRAGFYSAGNWFPDESWVRYLRQARGESAE